MNCHRIPKFLTKPWEDSGKFNIFSFSENRFYCKNAGTFFAEKDRFASEQEQWWNKNVETDFARLKDSKEKIIKVKFKYIKAMYLLLPSIVERSTEYTGKLCSDFEEFDEQSMRLWYQKNELLILNASEKLMFPENGFFPIHFLTQGDILRTQVVIGVPIWGNKVLVQYDRQINYDDIFTATAGNGQYLVCASVSNCGDKVIVHPDMLNQYNEEQLSKKLIKMRNTNVAFEKYYNGEKSELTDLFKLVDEVRNKIF